MQCKLHAMRYEMLSGRRPQVNRSPSRLYDGALRILSAIFALALALPAHAGSQTLKVAAAADLQFALNDLTREFHRIHPDIDVSNVFGSSGNFYAEIGNHAPFDIFLSADSEYPRRLVEAKLAIPESLFVYGIGHIALWVLNSSPLDLPRLQMRALEAPGVKRIAIANPRHAPYGRAAEAAMKSTGVYDRISSKLVLGENIAQAFQFAQSGAADIGIVALSLALAPAARGQGRYWEIPQTAYPKMEQSGVILSRAKSLAAARQFCAFLAGAAAKPIWTNYGFY